MDKLRVRGTASVTVEELGHRSAFVGAVLATLPGASATARSPTVPLGAAPGRAASDPEFAVLDSVASEGTPGAGSAEEHARRRPRTGRLRALRLSVPAGVPSRRHIAKIQNSTSPGTAQQSSAKRLRPLENIQRRRS